MLNIKKLENTMSERNYTKVKLCSTIGIARTTLDAILNGSDAKISTIESIARALNVNIGYLFDEESSAVASGNGNVAISGNNNVTSNAVGDNAVLLEKIKFLEQQVKDKEMLIEEKERMIKLLIGDK